MTVMEEAPDLRFRSRLWLLLAAWVAAAVATVFPYPPLLRYAFLFPYGLMTFLVWLVGWKAQQAPHFLTGWVLYLVLTVSSLVTGKRLAYFVIYALLCVFLLLNAVGCHMMFHGYPKM